MGNWSEGGYVAKHVLLGVLKILLRFLSAVESVLVHGRVRDGGGNGIPSGRGASLRRVSRLDQAQRGIPVFFRDEGLGKGIRQASGEGPG